MTQAILNGFAVPPAPIGGRVEPRRRGDVVGTVRPAFPLRRLIKSAIGVALLAVGALATYQNVVIQTSRQAVINARIVPIRAPIDGVIEIGAVVLGESVSTADKIGRVADPHPEDSRLFALRQEAQATTRDHSALVQRIAVLEQAHSQAVAQAAAYQAGRVQQDEARIAEAQANLAAARAREDTTADTLRRGTVLRQHNVLSDQAYEQVRDAFNVAHNKSLAAQGRLDALNVDLAAARQGTFLGDNYNDVPSSVQRAHELAIQIAEAHATLDQLADKRAAVETELATERQRLEARSVAPLVLPVAGNIWMTNVASGQYVRKGQDLFAVLDCGSVVVTASVSDGVYNRARLGDPVRFRVAGTGREYSGTVTKLGLAAGGGNFAIAPSEGRHLLAVDVPGLARSATDHCAVGRIGEIVFEEAHDGVASQALAATIRALRTLRRSLGIA